MTCVICGCTDSTPCPGGCAWLRYEPPVCTSCVERAWELCLINQADLDHYDDFNDPALEGILEPLIVQATPYEAQCYIEERRRAMGGRV